MNYKELIFVWIGITSFFYIPIGIMLHKRSKRKAIRNRSPVLVLIIHWSNYLQCCLFLTTLYLSVKNTEPSLFDGIYRALSIVLHYSKFFPFLQRCYRVYFIFKLDCNIDEADSTFRKNIHRASQNWQVKIYLLSLLPILLIAGGISYFDITEKAFPIAFYDVNSQSITEIVYLLALFLEEISFVFAVYALRNVNDDYNMTKELTLICTLWILTGLVSIYPNDTVWRICEICKDHIIMIICSCYPLYNSFKESSFEEVLTLEMLQSLDLILQCRTTLEAFEDSLRSYNVKIKEHSCSEYLQLWLKCEYSKYNPDNDMIQNEAVISASNLQLQDNSSINSIQSEVYNILNDICFPHFKKSQVYLDLMRYITKQQIYINRLLQTSF
ncbi:unnamed protein product [Blepharisma stoltei]|uniref:RGS domain-containing protein n=1 Tax=Blepharisma stoltei TaxID=1481888 RepID=A0AAU9JX98_9CILI|nr:unnamed protein product [Blepharisma stoltei]